MENIKEKKIRDYIKQKYPETIKNTVAQYSTVLLPKPYSVPSITNYFQNFYYWDTYFTNLGLLEDGNFTQVENNLDNMKFLIEKCGFMPNADHLLNRSQPPLFTRGVYDFYKFTGDINIVKKYIDSIQAELNFWYNNRTAQCGLAQYGYSATDEELEDFYLCIANRLKYEPVSDRKTRIERAKSLMAIAESGWDFNRRFQDCSYEFNAIEYVEVELNSYLYDAELKCAEMLKLIGKEADAQKYSINAENRKNLMFRYMLNEKDGIMYDYNFVSGKKSKLLSVASVCPFAMGVMKDNNTLKKLIESLDLEHGISICGYQENTKFLQWDYPMLWPPMIYFCFVALENAGLSAEKKQVADKYNKLLEDTFETTGQLWEKYDATLGNCGNSFEYETPPMLGWTAGVYIYFKKKLQ